jgi:predicted negative regulator of RcsB-dependent stress response
LAAIADIITARISMTKTGAAAGPAFDDRAESAMDWARENGKPIGIGLAVLAVAAIGWFGMKQYRNSQADQAEAALNRARQSYSQGNLPLAQTDLRRVITRFGGSAAGSQASMLLAQVYYEQGKADSGLKVLTDGDPANTDEAAFEALKGAGLEQKKEYAQAAERYRAAANATDAKIAKERYLADAARALTSAGNKAEAAKLWSSLATDNTSTFAAEAKVRLGELVATPAAK